MSSTSSAASLTEIDVFDLVLEYLSTKGFTEAESVLKKEAKRGNAAAAVAVPPAKSTSLLGGGGTRLEDMLEKSYVTEQASGSTFFPRKRARTHLDGMLKVLDGDSEEATGLTEASSTAPVLDEENRGNRPKKLSMETQLVSFNPMGEKDPYGAAVMPLYQTSTFEQPAADKFGDYDYTRSGNPTRDALQLQVANLENSEGARCFAFTTGMAAISAVARLVSSGEEVIVNDDSYGGTYRLMSKVATRHNITVKYVQMSGKGGAANLASAITPKTKIVMIESPTNPMQRICHIHSLAEVCHTHANAHPDGTLLSIDNTMMSPILQRPLEHGADIVIHSATKFMCGHSDVMAGVVTVKHIPGNEKESKSLAERLYFFQNAEGTALSPFDSWLITRGIKTMALRVNAQMDNAVRVAQYLQSMPLVKTMYYAGLESHPDYSIHITQASGGGSVVCFETGDIELSKHIVTHTKLFKITVSFGSVSSLISLPCNMSHASIPDDVKAAREFPVDLVRISVGIEDADDLINDLQATFASYGKVTA